MTDQPTQSKRDVVEGLLFKVVDGSHKAHGEVLLIVEELEEGLSWANAREENKDALIKDLRAELATLKSRGEGETCEWWEDFEGIAHTQCKNEYCYEESLSDILAGEHTRYCQGCGGLILNATEFHAKWSIPQWEKHFSVEILDPDGFDRSDPDLMENEYSREEFLRRLAGCTVSDLRAVMRIAGTKEKWRERELKRIQST